MAEMNAGLKRAGLALTGRSRGRVPLQRGGAPDSVDAAWLAASGYDPQGTSAVVAVRDGAPLALVGGAEPRGLFDMAASCALLPPGRYACDGAGFSFDDWLGLGLDQYRFARYKAAPLARSYGGVGRPAEQRALDNALQAHFLVRDLVNTPAEDMGPEALSETARQLANSFGGKFRQVKGPALLKQNFPLIHAVGRASPREPRLIELTWGKAGAPLLALVGKGICFDTGGLDLKPSQYMRYMKKDMGGAAHVLGLARWIMSENLPVRLLVLVAAADNAVDGNAFRPGDVFASRKGLTVEIDNTDAEGRLVLADALAYASEKRPAAILDFATLTGAARVALGTQCPAMFSSDDGWASRFFEAGQRRADPVWRLPLFDAYRRGLDSSIADLVNCAKEPFGGAITAALFLQCFVSAEIPWTHFDVMAYNTGAMPGRPEGGEAMGLRASFEAIRQWLGEQ